MSSCPARSVRDATFVREGWDAEGRVVLRIRGCAHSSRRHEGPCGVRPARPFRHGDGTVGSDREPVALFTGKAVHAYLGHLSDAPIEAMLNELATELGAAFGQERIYVARPGLHLDAGEHRG